MLKVILLIILTASTSGLFAQTKSKQASGKAKVAIPPKSDFYLPYPKKFSIPIEIQNVIIKYIQDDKNLVQKYEFVYSDISRLKGYLTNTLQQKLELINNERSALEKDIEEWLEYGKRQGGQTHVDNFEDALQKYNFHQVELSMLYKDGSYSMSQGSSTLHHLKIEHQEACSAYFEKPVKWKSRLAMALLEIDEIKSDSLKINSWN